MCVCFTDYTPVLVGGIIGELLGTLAIAALIVGSGVAISRKLRERGKFQSVCCDVRSYIALPTYIAHSLSVCSCTIIKFTERRLNAQFELDLKSSEEHIEIPTNTPGTSVSSV